MEKKVDLDPYIILCTKTNLIWLLDLNIKAKFIKYLEINYKKKFVTSSGQKFLRKYAKALSIRTKNDELDIIKIKNLCTSKTFIKNMKIDID